MSTETLLLTPIEQLINRILLLDPASSARLEALNGRDLGLKLTDPARALRVIFDSEGLTLISDDTDMSDCDVILEASLAGLTGLVLSRGQRSRDVSFRGDVGMIQEIRAVFADLDVDIEAQLGRFLGPDWASRVINGAQSSRQWSERTARTLLANAGELATEERRWLPSAAEAADFLDGVDQVRERLDRLDARVKRLERTEPPQ